MSDQGCGLSPGDGAPAANVRPEHVGICALEVYLPPYKVMQSEMEEVDGCKGKYTVGLGQVSMSYCSDREDVASMALNAVTRLMQKCGLHPGCVGRLEVGSEGGLDRSKSIKSVVSRLFRGAWGGLEGVDNVHGCYGGTAALLNCAAWVESSAWDGRWAVAVATDVAMYAPDCPGRPTGGCGAVALLVGPDAPLALDPAWRITVSDDTDDFCKPIACGAFPVVDGLASQHHMMRATEQCHSLLRDRLRVKGVQGAGAPLSHCSHFVCHSPFNKMVRKLFARLHSLEATQQQQRAWQGGQEGAVGSSGRIGIVGGSRGSAVGAASGREAERLAMEASAAAYEVKVAAGAEVQQQVGNIYTGSLWLGVAGLVESFTSVHADTDPTQGPDSTSNNHWQPQTQQPQPMQQPPVPPPSVPSPPVPSPPVPPPSVPSPSRAEALEGQLVLLLSYGSGLMASLLGLRIRAPQGRQPPLQREGGYHGSDLAPACCSAQENGTDPSLSSAPAVQQGSCFTLRRMAKQVGVRHRIACQRVCSVTEYREASEQVARCLHSPGPYLPQGSLQHLEEGAWYLQEITHRGGRVYACKGHDGA